MYLSATICGVFLFLAASSAERPTVQPRAELTSGKKLETIFNNDCNSILCALDGKKSSADDYRRIVRHILAMKPGVLAQHGRLPDAVLFRTKVGATFDKYRVEVSKRTWLDASDEIADRQRDILAKLHACGVWILVATRGHWRYITVRGSALEQVSTARHLTRR